MSGPGALTAAILSIELRQLRPEGRTIPRQQPAELLADDDRWQLLQRCLSDVALPVDVRAAGALTLLFGLPAERIRHLTADQLSSKDHHTYLTAGLRPILLPPRLATLLTPLATTHEPQRRLKLPPGHDTPR